MLTDRELDGVRPHSGLHSREMWAYIYGFLLGRPVTVEEVSDAHERLHEQYYAAHPDERPTYTLADITRSESVHFWSRQM